jgi:hypothetical protein
MKKREIEIETVDQELLAEIMQSSQQTAKAVKEIRNLIAGILILSMLFGLVSILFSALSA